ncbi:DUF4494 domain-containing protein [Saccharicrinis sp. FJH54]|uniref:DUF4494 domain-containing protein n=1 Tax=Saccharicrinis sp. FJH54 TaxID=3344665 RepID=UPI0035D51750
MNWFEVKVKYQKIDEQGKEKKVSEPYLVDAVSFTEAEARTYEELKAYLGEEFNILNIKRANYSDLFFFDSGDRWFKCKVVFITLDEEKGVEKKTSNYMLVQATEIDEALANLTESMKDLTVDYTVQSIQETPIMDVFPYFKDENENEDIAGLTPVSEIEANEEFDSEV